MQKKTLFQIIVILVLIAILATSPFSAGASHSGGGYHWARTSNPFILKLGDNVSGAWDSKLGIASSDWSKSSVLDTKIVAGGTTPTTCRPTFGRVEVCSANYGNTGWLGLATIWITSGKHIVQGTVKNNDYYFGNSTYKYNNSAEMQHVICQEIGHTFGLAHQDVSGISLNTCMDYYRNTSASDTKSTHPNQHDYDELLIIYKHLDGSTTVRSSARLPSEMSPGDFSQPNSWGKLVSSSKDGSASTYVHDFGKGNLVITYVIWGNE